MQEICVTGQGGAPRARAAARQARPGRRGVGFQPTLGAWGSAGQVAGGFNALMRLKWDVTPEVGRALDGFRDNRVDW